MQTTIGNEWITVVIDEMGAQMLSIRDRNGVEWLWNGEERYWKGRAPILFPIAGALKEDAYYLRGKRYEMPKHGYIRSLPWKLESRDQTSAVFSIREKHPGFPFDYTLQAKYELIGPEIAITYTVTNLGEDIFYYGIGSHEGFALSGPLSDYRVHFEETECLACQTLEGSLMTHEAVILAQDTNTLALSEELFAEDALVFLNLKSRAVTLESKAHTRKLRVEYPGCGVLLLWKVPDAGFLCIEPWENAPDYIDSDMQISRKPGCTCLNPGQTATHSHRIQLMF